MKQSKITPKLSILILLAMLSLMSTTTQPCLAGVLWSG